VGLRPLRAHVHARERRELTSPPRPQPRQQPSDGSNWELLCVYCHDNEHQRHLEATGGGEASPAAATHSPFADLKAMLERKK